ncbi:PspC domain-containing protein [Thalassotalea sp. LPB0316]|uniref:PspC domain-containing protein n=1 Tax=Thalassotalea sp. LPB0316 TaxID=2769490 RepID=UPI00186784E5|nr:PspC domain-containing protein [Thalassotalea sp. LPB0316]QOL25925.1 PspC domain-containing protein [Thalassotalea sp. LPB0316]
MDYRKSYRIKRVLTKDLVHKKISGVCGGIAKHYNTPRLAVRAAAVCLFLMFPVAMLIAYIGAAILIPNR